MKSSIFAGVLVAASTAAGLAQAVDAGWPTYGGDAGGQRYSAAKQIDRTSIARLHPVWVYHTHALDSGRVGSRSAAFETTPILFRGLLYLTTPFDEIIALDPLTGAERWRTPTVSAQLHEGDLIASRGVAAWDGGGTGVCAARLFEGTVDGQIVAVDAATGSFCDDFGQHGRIDLRAGLEGIARVFQFTSAPTVLGDVVVLGSSIPDNSAVNMARGTVRAFDVHTGRLVWSWEPIPWGPRQKIPTGAGNAWSAIAADPALGLIYVPTGSASPDYYGGMRPGDGRDADSVVALEAATGRRVWGFQVVHHDLWDYDVASEPLLFTWHGDVPAVAVTTKMGMVFVLDRRTGTPLVLVEERAVPKSDVPGEMASVTQPFSSLPLLSGSTMREEELGKLDFERDPEDAAYCKQQMAGLRYDGIYTPPSLKGTIEFPGAIGGVNWGSAAYDPASGILYANTNRLPYAVQLIPQDNWIESNWPWLLLGGSFGFAAIFGFGRRRSWKPGWIAGIVMIASAAGMVWYGVFYAGPTLTVEQAMRGAFGEDYGPQDKAPYRLYRHPIVDLHGLPCTPGRWGTVAALNLETGKMVWEVAHGTQVPGRMTGSVSLGGVLVTEGGLVFSAATKEPVLRAYDAATGETLWTGPLPVPAQATPMSYQIDGRQFVVIADGGHGLFGTKTGDSVIAYGVD